MNQQHLQNSSSEKISTEEKINSGNDIEGVHDMNFSSSLRRRWILWFFLGFAISVITWCDHWRWKRKQNASKLKQKIYLVLAGNKEVETIKVTFVDPQPLLLALFITKWLDTQKSGNFPSELKQKTRWRKVEQRNLFFLREMFRFFCQCHETHTTNLMKKIQTFLDDKVFSSSLFDLTTSFVSSSALHRREHPIFVSSCERRRLLHILRLVETTHEIRVLRHSHRVTKSPPPWVDGGEINT